MSHLVAGVASARKSKEDRWCVVPLGGPQGKPTAGSSFCAACIFDGHAGYRAAETAARELPRRLHAALHQCKDDIVEAAAATATELAKDVKHGAAVGCAACICPPDESGSTMCLCIVRERPAERDVEVVTANVGDSRAVACTMGHCTPTARALTRDHSLDDESERARIKAAGGRVARRKVGGEEVGPLRVWPGGIAVSRRLGGPPSVEHVLCSDADVSRTVLSSDERRIVVASDGLWNAITLEQCAKVCSTAGMDPTDAAKALVNAAVKARGLHDDITVVVIDRAMEQGNSPRTGKFSALSPSEADITHEVPASITNSDDVTVHPNHGIDGSKRASFFAPWALPDLLKEVPSRAIGPGGNVDDTYAMGDLVGRGQFAAVHAASPIAFAGTKVAVKTVHKESNLLDLVRNELDALVAMKEAGGHSNVMDLFATFETKHVLHFVTDLYSGGTLTEHISQLSKLGEGDIAITVRQVLSALSFLHSCGVLHLDIKPDNIMVRSAGGEHEMGRVVLADFGSAILFDPKSREAREHRICRGLKGTKYFAAPEVLRMEWHGALADVYSVGMTAHVLLCGMPPADSALRTHHAKLLKGDVESTLPTELSATGKAFMRQLLAPAVKDRPTAQLAKESAELWAAAGMSHAPSLRAAQAQSMKYNAAANYEGAVLAALAAGLSKAGAKKLRKCLPESGGDDDHDDDHDHDVLSAVLLEESLAAASLPAMQGEAARIRVECGDGPELFVRRHLVEGLEAYAKRHERLLASSGDISLRGGGGGSSAHLNDTGTDDSTNGGSVRGFGRVRMFLELQRVWRGALPNHVGDSVRGGGGGGGGGVALDHSSSRSLSTHLSRVASSSGIDQRLRHQMSRVSEEPPVSLSRLSSEVAGARVPHGTDAEDERAHGGHTLYRALSTGPEAPAISSGGHRYVSVESQESK